MLNGGAERPNASISPLLMKPMRGLASSTQAIACSMPGMASVIGTPA